MRAYRAGGAGGRAHRTVRPPVTLAANTPADERQDRLSYNSAKPDRGGAIGTDLRRIVNAVTLATPLGLALARYGRAVVVPGPDGLLLACEYAGYVPAPRARAVTVGNVVLLRMSHEQALARPQLLAHESRHASQWACWLGPWGFLAAYGLASLWSLLRVGDAATANPFEVRAGLADGGYRLSERVSERISRSSRRRGRRSPSR